MMRGPTLRDSFIMAHVTPGQPSVVDAAKFCVNTEVIRKMCAAYCTHKWANKETVNHLVQRLNVTAADFAGLGNTGACIHVLNKFNSQGRRQSLEAKPLPDNSQGSEPAVAKPLRRPPPK